MLGKNFAELTSTDLNLYKQMLPILSVEELTELKNGLASMYKDGHQQLLGPQAEYLDPIKKADELIKLALLNDVLLQTRKREMDAKKQAQTDAAVNTETSVVKPETSTSKKSAESHYAPIPPAPSASGSIQKAESIGANDFGKSLLEKEEQELRAALEAVMKPQAVTPTQQPARAPEVPLIRQSVQKESRYQVIPPLPSPVTDTSKASIHPTRANVQQSGSENENIKAAQLARFRAEQQLKKMPPASAPRAIPDRKAAVESNAQPNGFVPPSPNRSPTPVQHWSKAKRSSSSSEEPHSGRSSLGSQRSTPSSSGPNSPAGSPERSLGSPIAGSPTTTFNISPATSPRAKSEIQFRQEILESHMAVEKQLKIIEVAKQKYRSQTFSPESKTSYLETLKSAASKIQEQQLILSRVAKDPDYKKIGSPPVQIANVNKTAIQLASELANQVTQIKQDITKLTKIEPEIRLVPRP